MRRREDVQQLLSAGAQRVVVGSLAVREPALVLDWLSAFGGDALTIALDTRQDDSGEWRLPVHGWTQTANDMLDTLAARYAESGLRHLLCTDIARDGMLSGPNIALYQRLRVAHPTLAIQASGGARNAEDVMAARAAGCAGIVLGKALLVGNLQLPEALAC